jgi:hypothetical protein
MPLPFSANTLTTPLSTLTGGCYLRTFSPARLFFAIAAAAAAGALLLPLMITKPVSLSLVQTKTKQVKSPSHPLPKAGASPLESRSPLQISISMCLSTR